MRCPFCAAAEDKVIDSRTSKDGSEIRRRRECNECERRFTTYERIEEAMPVVIKADKRREPFDRNKIEKGLRRAIGKRPVPVHKISELAEAVERELVERGVQELPASDVGASILPKLRKLDEVSYVRYASIYRDFRDIDEFVSELSDIIKSRSR